MNGARRQTWRGRALGEWRAALARHDADSGGRGNMAGKRRGPSGVVYYVDEGAGDRGIKNIIVMCLVYLSSAISIIFTKRSSVLAAARTYPS